MSPIKIAIFTTAAADVNIKTLKLGPTRMVRFLQGVTDSAIRAQLAHAGWSEEHADEACALISDLRLRSVAAPPVDDVVATAMSSCEEWQSAGLNRFRAMLQMTRPVQATFLFHDFVPGKGFEAVLNVRTFLERRQALDKGADRKASRKADHEALAIMERCGATAEELKRLGREVDVVMTSMSAEVAQVDTSEEQRLLETLQKIWVWTTTWSEIARTTSLARDQLIRLGVAKRRSRKAPAPIAPAPTPPSPAPPLPVQDEAAPNSRAA